MSNILNNVLPFGAWIFPNGNVHYTSNIMSHSKVIDELNIRDELINQSKIIKFSDLEIKRHFNIDLSYIALKIGFIRISSFYNQLGIQFENDYSDIRFVKHKHIIINLCNEFCNKTKKIYNISYENIIIEQLSSNTYKSFTYINDFFHFLQTPI